MGGIADLDALADEAELRTPDSPTAPANGAAVPEPVNPEDFFHSDGLLVEKLAKRIQTQGHVQLGSDGRLYRYCRGVYRPDGECFARVRTREILARRFRGRHSQEVLAWLHAHFPTVPEQPSSEIVNVANGLLRWKTGELSPHAADLISTVQLPVRWNPGAECPRIEACLDLLIPAEAHAFLFELVGYLVFTGNPFRVAILLLGPGANGKSTLLHLFVALLGTANVATVPLQMLAENRFAAAELYGKLANICGDLDARAIKHTDVFKMLTGGDRMLAERKHQAPFSFRPFAVPVFSANEAPISADQTEAWFDRWIVLPMERRLDANEVDPNMAAKLTTSAELEGLLVRAVEGLRRLMQRGRFDLPEIVKRGREDYREQLDTVAGFLAEGAVFDVTAWTPRPELYAAYRLWCERSGRLAVGAAKFYGRLRDGHPDQLADRTREGTRGFAGLRLRPGGA